MSQVSRRAGNGRAGGAGDAAMRVLVAPVNKWRRAWVKPTAEQQRANGDPSDRPYKVLKWMPTDEPATLLPDLPTAETELEPETEATGAANGDAVEGEGTEAEADGATVAAPEAMDVEMGEASADPTTTSTPVTTHAAAPKNGDAAPTAPEEPAAERATDGGAADVDMDDGLAASTSAGVVDTGAALTQDEAPASAAEIADSQAVEKQRQIEQGEVAPEGEAAAEQAGETGAAAAAVSDDAPAPVSAAAAADLELPPPSTPPPSNSILVTTSGPSEAAQQLGEEDTGAAVSFAVPEQTPPSEQEAPREPMAHDVTQSPVIEPDTVATAPGESSTTTAIEPLGEGDPVGVQGEADERDVEIVKASEASDADAAIDASGGGGGGSSEDNGAVVQVVADASGAARPEEAAAEAAEEAKGTMDEQKHREEADESDLSEEQAAEA